MLKGFDDMRDSTNAWLRRFKLDERGTNARTEILAGLTTFLTMAYIIAVNPLILSKGGMDFAGVLTATVIVSAASSILMGLVANLPYALAPGMGINAFVTYTLILGRGVTWQTALGTVFVSGLIFIALTVSRVRTLVVRAIPSSLRHAVAAGIGLFLALIGMAEIDFIRPGQGTIVAFGGFHVQTLLFLFGMIVTGYLVCRRVRGALVLAIILNAAAAAVVGWLGVQAGWLQKPVVQLPERLVSMPRFTLFLKMDLRSVFSIGMVGPLFTLLFTDMFDSISTFLGVAHVGNLLDDDGQPLDVDKALLVDAVGTTISGLFGTSSATTYIESAAGIEEGGRTGLTAVVAGLLFLPFMFFSPAISLIPAVATAPVLVIIGVFMAQTLAHIQWRDMDEAIPAFLACVLIPLTYSITQGIVWGLLAYTTLKLLLGKRDEVSWTLLVIDVFAVIALILL